MSSGRGESDQFSSGLGRFWPLLGELLGLEESNLSSRAWVFDSTSLLGEEGRLGFDGDLGGVLLLSLDFCPNLWIL